MMIKRGASGRIESYQAQAETKTHAGQRRDGSIFCMACTRLLTCAENLDEGKFCPYCHNDVDKPLGGRRSAAFGPDTDIAQPC